MPKSTLTVIKISQLLLVKNMILPIFKPIPLTPYERGILTTRQKENFEILLQI